MIHNWGVRIYAVKKLNVERCTSNGDIPLPGQLLKFDNFPFSEFRGLISESGIFRSFISDYSI